MEFYFRSGKDRDAFFSASHALSGGLVELGRESITTREALQPERLREELIAREIERRRVLDEELRRVMELERELAIRRQFLQAELGLGTGLAKEQIVPDSLTMPHFWEPREEDERPPLALHAEPIKMIELIPSPQPDHPKKQSPLVPEIQPSKLNLTVTKRKTPEVTSEWGCALCHVSTTSKEALYDHLQGEKHKAKEALLGICKTAADSEGGSSSTSRQALMPFMGEGVPARDPANGGKNTESQNIWCELCSVMCSSETVMTFHLQGKKHRAHLKGSNKEVSKARTSTASSTEEVKKVMDQVAKEEKKEDPQKIEVDCVPAEKKRRGDPPKIEVDCVPAEKKRRGDPPKIEVNCVPAKKEKKEDREEVDDMKQNIKGEEKGEKESSKANGMQVPASDATEETSLMDFFWNCQFDVLY